MKNKVFKTMLFSAALLQVGVTATPAVQVLANEKEKPTVVTAIDTGKKDPATAKDTKVEIDSLNAKIKSLEDETKKLKENQAKVEKEIKVLADKIIEYNKQLEKQAQSAQKTNSSNSNQLESLLNAKSVGEAVKKLTAMNAMADANSKAVKEFKDNKAELDAKQKANNTELNKIIENEQTLKTEKARLEVLKAEQEKAEAKKKADADALKAATDRAARAAAGLTAAENEVTGFHSAESASKANAEAIAKANSSQLNITYNYAGAGSYPAGQCTWGVKVLAPWAGPYWGNGADWSYSAEAAGFKVGTTPMVGSIISWDDGGYGHVAYVTAVNGNQIQVLESNYNGRQWIGNHRGGWFNPIGIMGQVRYIYPPGT